MRMLEKLRKKLSSIKNEWEHDFIEGLVIEMEEGRDFKVNPLSDAQFCKLVELDTKYDTTF